MWTMDGEYNHRVRFLEQLYRRRILHHHRKGGGWYEAEKKASADIKKFLEKKGERHGRA